MANERWEVRNDSGDGIPDVVQVEPQTMGYIVCVAPTEYMLSMAGWPERSRLIAAAPDFREGMAYFLMLGHRLGAYMPADLIEWSRSILKGKNRTGIEVARAAIIKATGAGAEGGTGDA